MAFASRDIMHVHKEENEGRKEQARRKPAVLTHLQSRRILAFMFHSIQAPPVRDIHASLAGTLLARARGMAKEIKAGLLREWDAWEVNVLDRLAANTQEVRRVRWRLRRSRGDGCSPSPTPSCLPVSHSFWRTPT